MMNGTISAIRQLLLNHLQEIEDTSTKEHLKYVGCRELRLEMLKKHHNRYLDIIRTIANGLGYRNLDRAVEAVRKSGELFARQSLKDGLTIEEATNGISFLKEIIWREIEKAQLLAGSTVAEYHRLNRAIGMLIDAAGSQIANTYHAYYRKAEEEQRRLAAIVNSSEDAIISKDLNSVITSWNSAAEKMFGFKESEAVGKHIGIIIPISLMEEERDMISKISRGIATEHYQTVRVTREGKGIVVSLTASPVKNARGEIIGASAIIRDITPQKKVEHALQKEIKAQIAAQEKVRLSEEKFMKAFSSNPAAIAMTTLKEGLFSDVNETWIDLVGYSREDTLGHTSKELSIWPKDADRERFVNELMQKGQIRGWEQEFRKKTGETFIAQLSAQIMEAGGKKLVVSTLVDITDRKRLERQKDEFLGVASHELKTPVTSIKAYTQVLQLAFERKKDLMSAGLLEKMDVQIDKLNSLIADLLDVTRIESGRIRFREGYFRFNGLVEEVVEEVQRTAPRHTIEVRLDDDRVVYGDRERTGQVIVNLLTNAVKYSPKTGRVILSTTCGQDTITLCVKDFGIGIPKEKQDKVFTRFYRIERDGGGDTYPGLGLGLYISAEIVKREGGTIWVESDAGKGASFCFSLPARKRIPAKQSGRPGKGDTT